MNTTTGLLLSKQVHEQTLDHDDTLDPMTDPTTVSTRTPTNGYDSAAARRSLAPVRKMINSQRFMANITKFLLGLLSITLFVGFWYLATKYRWDFYIRFTSIPTPGDVFTEALILSHQEDFYKNMALSLWRIILGFGIATVLGVLFGLIIGRYRLVHSLLFPILEILRPIPAIAWVPISIMLWPTNESSIVFITFLGSFFPILVNTIEGVSNQDKILISAARSLGAGEFALMREVILPGALPSIFTGLAIGMGVAWVSLIAAEMISGEYGIGYFTWEAYSLIQYNDIVIGMIVIGILGLACSGIIRLMGRILMPWHSTYNGRN